MVQREGYRPYRAAARVGGGEAATATVRLVRAQSGPQRRNGRTGASSGGGQEVTDGGSSRKALMITSLTGLAAGVALSAVGFVVAQGGKAEAEEAVTVDALAAGNDRVRLGNGLQYGGWAVGAVAVNILLVSGAFSGGEGKRRASLPWKLQLGPGHAAVQVSFR